MKPSLLLLLLCVPALRADIIEPTITKTVTTTGTGFASASGFATPTENTVTAGVDVSVKTFAPGDTAYAAIDLQAEYVAMGTGSGVLSYSAEGGADGSLASVGVAYQLNDFSGSCFIEVCVGVGGPGGSEALQLGVPFYFQITGNASAGYPLGGNFGEDAGGVLNVNFGVTENGVPVQLTEVPLLTPEPGTIGLAGLGLLSVMFVTQLRKRRRSRISPVTNWPVLSKFRKDIYPHLHLWLEKQPVCV